MNIAIPNNGDMINQHFGKSESFAIVNVENGKITGEERVSAAELAHNHEGLAGLLVKNNVTLVITGGIGAGALNALKQFGLEVITGASGEYKDAVKKYIDGDLTDQKCMCNHHCNH